MTHRNQRATSATLFLSLLLMTPSLWAQEGGDPKDATTGDIYIKTNVEFAKVTLDGTEIEAEYDATGTTIIIPAVDRRTRHAVDVRPVRCV